MKVDMLKEACLLFCDRVLAGGKIMGRQKGEKNRRWTNEELLRYVLMCEDEHKPGRAVARECEIPYGTLDHWVRRYRNGGEKALNPEKLHPGNKYSALHTSKSLSETERLRLLVEKLRVENERLKKGYIVKGVGAAKEYVTLKDWNTR